MKLAFARLFAYLSVLNPRAKREIPTISEEAQEQAERASTDADRAAWALNCKELAQSPAPVRRSCRTHSSESVGRETFGGTLTSTSSIEGQPAAITACLFEASERDFLNSVDIRCPAAMRPNAASVA
jgi:hypothetical protein